MVNQTYKRYLNSNISAFLLPALSAIAIALSFFIDYKFAIILIFIGIIIFIFLTKAENLLLYGVIAFIPLFELSKFIGFATIPLILGIAFTFLWTIRVLTGGSKIYFTKEYMLFLSLFFIIVIASFMGADFDNSKYPIRLYFQSFLLVLLLANVFNNMESISYVSWVLVISITLISLLSLIETIGIYDLGFRELHEKEIFMRGKEVIERYGATRGDPNFWAVQLNIAFPFVFSFFILYQKLWIRISLSLLSGILLFSLFKTYSMSGILGIALIVCLTLIYSTKLKGSNKILGIFISLLIALSIIYFMPEEYKYRVSSKLFSGDDTTTGRIYSWIGGIKMIASNPLFGVGPGNSIFELPKYMEVWNPFKAVHNAYLSFGGEIGIPGLIIFLGIIAIAIRGLRRSIDLAKKCDDIRGVILGNSIYISLVAFLFQAIALDLQADKYLYVLLGMAMAFKHSVLKASTYAK